MYATVTVTLHCQWQIKIKCMYACKCVSVSCVMFVCICMACDWRTMMTVVQHFWVGICTIILLSNVLIVDDCDTGFVSRKCVRTNDPSRDSVGCSKMSCSFAMTASFSVYLGESIGLP